MKAAAAATFTGLVDLVAKGLGGKVLGANDEFFAGAENLIELERATFVPGKYTERGKWMDGWESRRKRGPGHDFCVLELGVAGDVLGFDIDTQHFSGNQPAFASVDGLSAPRGSSFESLSRGAWSELLAQSALAPDSQNLFAARSAGPVTHVRLNIFPDGGVARFRVYGRVTPNWSEREVDEATRPQLKPEWVDLAALKNGALAQACSNAHFSPMNNLILPGRAADMGGGWETRRRRGPGHDWILIRLGARGRPQLVEVDTGFFKGNYPDRCALEAIDAPEARITDLLESPDFVPLLPETKLGADTRHFFPIQAPTLATHVRLSIFPDGGVSRLRLWGTRDG
jgi:allantoicase